MIARIILILLVVAILPDLYIDRRLLRRKTRYRWWQRLLWWLPTVALCAYGGWLALMPGFAPSNAQVLNVYLFAIGVLVLPKAAFALCSLLGWGHCRFHHTHTNWGNLIGLLLAAGIIYIVVYGSTVGFAKLTIRHEDYYSPDLPPAFDNYRIVHFSDAHTGTFSGSNSQLLRRTIDSINAQRPDLICFTGDLQNVQPSELYPHLDTYAQLRATDGVYAVLGNHDYADYIHASDIEKAANERELISRERQFGWHLLLNEHATIKRTRSKGSTAIASDEYEDGATVGIKGIEDSAIVASKSHKNSKSIEDCIVIAGIENDGQPPFQQRGDIQAALNGVDSNAFVIMLEHDPTAWRRTILPDGRAHLTLSGHTHAMQFALFGWSPAALLYSEWGGMYYEEASLRAINVSYGMGGFIPFRFGASNEITVITLHRSPKPRK